MMTSGPTSSGTDTASDGPGYIRGGGGVAVGRRVGTAIAAGAALVLAALFGALAVEAAQQYHRLHLLNTEGIPVVATVTDCFGVASGTGITDVGFTCHAAFRIGPHIYRADLDGTTSLYPAGASVSAVAVPVDPTILYTAAAARTTSASLAVFVVPAVLLAATFALLVVTVRCSRAGTTRPDGATDQL